MHRLLLVLGLLLHFAPCEAQSRWQSHSNGVQSIEMKIENSFLFPPTLYAFRISLKDFSVEVLSAERFGESRLNVRQFAQKSGAVLAINSNYFNELGKALGLLVSSTKQLSPLHRSGSALTGVFMIKTGNPMIIDRARYTSALAPTVAVQAGPRLISEGKALKVESRERARRAGVCIDRRANLVFFIAPSAFRGITLGELQQVLLKPQLGCYDALNFDGGGSAQLYFADQSENVTASWQGQDDVPAAIALVPR